jgi:hypothetical protein
MSFGRRASDRPYPQLSVYRWLLGMPLLVACSGDPAADAESGTSESGTGMDTTETDTETGTDTGPELAECDPDAFEHAPPNAVIDGLPVVPIDIHDLDAQMTFSFEDESILVDVTMTFQVGEQGGMPLFDLRQDILAAELDGEMIDPALLARHDFGRGESYGFRVLEQELEPCWIHTLRLGYWIGQPQDGPVDAIDWSIEGLTFNSKFQESVGQTKPSLYLDSWLPANMPFDRHTMSVAVLVEAAPFPHMVITNGALEELAEHQWQLEFGAETTSVSPYIGIAPADPITTVSGVHAAPNGQNIPYVLHHNGALSVDCLIEACESTLLSYVSMLVGLYGPYQHLTLTGHIADDVTYGAYDGMTTSPQSNGLIINLAASWWGAGIHPASYTDAWLKHGWAFYSLQNLNYQNTFDWNEPPHILADQDPFARNMHPDPLNQGNVIFAGLAAIIGPQAVPETMREIYLQHAPLGSLSTTELERQFYCLNGQEPDIRRAFWRYVYGYDGEPEPAAADYCD